MCVSLKTHHFIPDALAVLANAKRYTAPVMEQDSVNEMDMDMDEKEIEEEPLPRRKNIRKIVSLLISSFPIHSHLNLNFDLLHILLNSHSSIGCF